MPARQSTDVRVDHSLEIPEPLTVLDLFAGAGGLSTGLARAATEAGGVGFRTVEAIEMDRAAAATYSLNHVSTAVFSGSIQDWLARGEVPSVDVIVGGPPCQGFSTLGKQDVEDSRNQLWREYARTIVAARPKWFVVENVAAFLTSPQYAEFVAETQEGGTLAEYTVQAKILNAADFGAPQARKRAVMIGHRRSLPFPGWPEPTHDQDGYVSVASALAGVQEHCTRTRLPERTVEFDGVHLAGPFTTTELHVARDYTKLSLERFAHIRPGGNRFQLPDRLKAPCWIRHTTGSGDVMGRLWADRPAVTIRTEFFKPEKGRYLHPTEDRAITHLEAALLQGFPTDYQWVGSKVAIARQIGNAVPIPLGAAIGRQLLAAAGREVAAAGLVATV